MSESGIGDLSRIVSLIMENPKLIEEISSLAKGDARESVPSTEISTPEQTGTASEESISVSATPARVGGSARSQLLGALKPYVSAQRAGAIDSMLSIAEILDMMKAR